MWNTALLAILVPSVTIAVSLAFSWVVLRSRIPGRAGFDFIAFLPHAVPSIIFGVGALLIALYVVHSAIPIYGTIWILLIVFRDRAPELRNAYDQQRPHPDPRRAGRIGADQRRQPLDRVPPHHDPAARARRCSMPGCGSRCWSFANSRSPSSFQPPATSRCPSWYGACGSAAGSANRPRSPPSCCCMMTPMIALYWFLARRQGLLATSA